ncbi:MAG: hypothetical protein NT069_16180 [Planctomycetota bacterium]|nr:hypothetical protein [Planctomycetota bacterium]
MPVTRTKSGPAGLLNFTLSLRPRSRAFRLAGLLVGSLVSSWLLVGSGLASDTPYEQEPISYGDSLIDDPVSQLQKQLESGEKTLKYEPRQGYLRAVLEALRIPHSSQTLVFSKTSFQRDRIAPETPRAVYFNDDVYIGWVQGGEVVEVSAVDSQKGAIFYSLSQNESDSPRFRRHTHECLQCHDSSLSQGVPGHILRSVYTDVRGQAVLTAGTFITSPQSPLKERFGGWYVSGKHGDQVHMGNLIVRDKEHKQHPERINLAAGGNQTDLGKYFEVSPYLTPHSDLVALQVLAHQVHVHNLITRANYHTRLAQRDQASINKALGKELDEPLESTRSRIRSVGEPLLRAILFADEPPLTAPIEGTNSFVADFSDQGPRDPQGRSLRELDLQRRLFRYPCSFLIYTPAFDALPEPQLDYLATRMNQILQGEDETGRYQNLTAADRQALREILTETKPDFAKRWEKSTRAKSP